MAETKVFGIGLNKTGTTSLGKALEILGFTNHMSCDLALTKRWAENDLESIFEVARKNNNFEDWPWPLVFTELFDEFNDAKFILTLRKSPEAWYKSLCDHALRTGPTEYRKLIYGYLMPHDFKDWHIGYYERHNQSVIDFFSRYAPEKLLVVCWEKGDGWPDLCRFLNKEIPNEEFPFLNRHPSKSKPLTLKNVIQKGTQKVWSNLQRTTKK